MRHFADNIINQGGVPVSGASVTVFITGTQNQPAIFSDDGITPKANPVITDSLGRFDFYVADGRYDLAVTGPTLLPFTLSNIEIADLTEAAGADTEWVTEGLRLVNQGVVPGAAPPGDVNLYTKTLDKRLYYKDDTGTEVGPLVPGGTTSPVNSPSPFVFNTDMEFKGPNPWIDIRNFGARASNPNTTPVTTGLTANCISGQSSVTISSASTFVNGDGVVLYGCGQTHSMATPSIASVTPSVALAGTGTLHSVPGAGGGTTFNYKMLARDRNGGLTAASPVVSTTTGAALGGQSVNITSMSRSARTVTVTTATAHGFAPGCNQANCGEVFIGGGNALTDSTFRGWYTVTGATDGTHFTFVSGPDSTLGASTSATGGQAVYFNNNLVCASTLPAGAVELYLLSDRNNPGTFSIIAAGYPNSSNGTQDICIEDFGSPMMDNQAFPPFIPAAAPWSVATSDHLSTTISSGAGSTTLTLVQAPGTTVSGATIRLDAAPGIQAAVNQARLNNGTVYIPVDPNGGQFPVNSWLNVGDGLTAFMQEGQLLLNDTFELPTNNKGAQYKGNIIPQGASGLAPGAWGSFSGVSVNTAHPGLWFSGSQQFGLHVSGLSLGAVPVNGSVLMVAEGGFNQQFDHITFSSGAGASDYMSMGLMLKGSSGQGNSNVVLDFVDFVTGGGSDAASHTPTLWGRGTGNVIIPRSYSLHRGMLLENGCTIGIGGIAYINGGGTPHVTTFGPFAGVVAGNMFADTIAQPCVAMLTTGSTLGTINFTQGPCVPSSSVLPVSGNYAQLQGIFDPTFYNSSGTSFTNTGGFVALTGQKFNSYVSIDQNHSLFTLGSAPARPTCTVSAGGSLPVGTYQFAVTPVWQSGEGLASPVSTACTVTSGNQTITINYSGVPGSPKGLNLYSCISNGTNCTGGLGASNTFNNPQAPGSTSFVWTSSAFNSAVYSGFLTGGPTMLLPGVQGIAAPALILGGSAVTAPTAGTLAVSTGSPASGNVAKYSSPTGSLIDSGIATSSLATVPLAVGNLAPGASGQCINTSGSVAIWGSCAGTAGVQLIGLPNTTPVSVNASTSAFQTLQAACATTPCYAAGALNTVGKTWDLEAQGTASFVNTSEFFQLSVVNAGVMNSFIPSSTGNAVWWLKMTCTTSTTGSSGTANCFYTESMQDGAGKSFVGSNTVSVGVNFTLAYSPTFQVSFGTPSTSNVATGAFALTHQHN